MPINDKPPVRGLDGSIGSIYFAIGVDGEGRVVRCITPVKHLLLLGCSGRGNYAQNRLKFRPGRWASERAACRREARTTAGKPVKSCRQQGGSMQSSTLCDRIRRNPSSARAEFTISHQVLDVYTQKIYRRYIHGR